MKILDDGTFWMDRALRAETECEQLRARLAEVERERDAILATIGYANPDRSHLVAAGLDLDELERLEALHREAQKDPCGGGATCTEQCWRNEPCCVRKDHDDVQFRNAAADALPALLRAAHDLAVVTAERDALAAEIARRNANYDRQRSDSKLNRLARSERLAEMRRRHKANWDALVEQRDSARAECERLIARNKDLELVNSECVCDVCIEHEDTRIERDKLRARLAEVERERRIAGSAARGACSKCGQMITEGETHDCPRSNENVDKRMEEKMRIRCGTCGAEEPYAMFSSIKHVCDYERLLANAKRLSDVEARLQQEILARARAEGQRDEARAQLEALPADRAQVRELRARYRALQDDIQALYGEREEVHQLCAAATGAAHAKIYDAVLALCDKYYALKARIARPLTNLACRLEDLGARCTQLGTRVENFEHKAVINVAFTYQQLMEANREAIDQLSPAVRAIFKDGFWPMPRGFETASSNWRENEGAVQMSAPLRPDEELRFLEKTRQYLEKIEFSTDPLAPYEHVDHPPHYQHPSKVEAIEVCRALPFSIGNAVKYLFRCGSKPGVSAKQDLEKALWYLRDADESDFCLDSGPGNRAARQVHAVDKGVLGRVLQELTIDQSCGQSRAACLDIVTAAIKESK